MPRQPQSIAAGSQHEGTPSVFTCPDCQGTLFLVNTGTALRFRCRIGHVYSPESMLDAQDDNVERLMWSAARALEEQAEYTALLSRELTKSDGKLAEECTAKARTARHGATILRRLITRGTEDRKGNSQPK